MSCGFTTSLTARPVLSDDATRSPYPPTPIVFEPPDPARWAYHVVRIDPREQAPLEEADLTTLGAEGWLLAGLLHLSEPRPSIHYYFIRAA